MAILETKKVTKTFSGVHAVHNLSINVEERKITSIVGPNGSGKSTLVNVLTGVLPLDGGKVVISNDVTLEQIKAYNVRLYGVTRTFQNIRLIEQMSVLDNILLAITKRGLIASMIESHEDFYLDQAKDVLEQVDMWGKRNMNAEELSYGQRKLVEIARALATKADIYLFDEPYAGLFPEMVKVVTKVMKELRDNGKTVVLIEHNMDIIRELSDHLIVMDAGELLAEGNPKEVLERRDVIEAYLGD